MYLKLPVYVIIVISFHNLPKTPSKSLIPRIFGQNLKFGIFSSINRKTQFSRTLTSLKRNCDVKWRAACTSLVSKKREDSYLSSSTKIIRIGGFTVKNLWGGGNHPPFGRRVTKNGPGRRGLKIGNNTQAPMEGWIRGVLPYKGHCLNTTFGINQPRKRCFLDKSDVFGVNINLHTLLNAYVILLLMEFLKIMQIYVFKVGKIDKNGQTQSFQCFQANSDDH